MNKVTYGTSCDGTKTWKNTIKLFVDGIEVDSVDIGGTCQNLNRTAQQIDNDPYKTVQLKGEMSDVCSSSSGIMNVVVYEQITLKVLAEKQIDLSVGKNTVRLTYRPHTPTNPIYLERLRQLDEKSRTVTRKSGL